MDKMVSKKLGVGGGTIGTLTYLATQSPEHTLHIALMITMLGVCYLGIQGYLDSKKERKYEDST